MSFCLSSIPPPFPLPSPLPPPLFFVPLLPAFPIHFCLLCTLSPFCDYHCSAATEISALNLVALTAPHSMLRVPPKPSREAWIVYPGQVHTTLHQARPPDTALSWLHDPSPITVQARLEKSRQKQSGIGAQLQGPPPPTSHLR